MGGTSAACGLGAFDGAEWLDVADPALLDADVAVPAAGDDAAEDDADEDDAPDDNPCPPPPATTTITTIIANPAAIAPAPCHIRDQLRCVRGVRALNRLFSRPSGANRRSTF